MVTKTNDDLLEASRLATMTTPAGLFTFGYDQNNQRISLVYPNDVTATYAYDIAGRLTNLSHTEPGGGVITSAGYTLDKVGSRTSKSGTTTETYAYDSIYRILQAVTPRGTENFTYDAVGNRLTGPGPRDTIYEHDAANRMTKGRQYSYAYDNNGNQTGRSTPNADKNWSLTWDYENRLAAMERTKGAEKRTVTFKYDPFGRRIEKKLVTIIDGVTRTTSTTYIYDNEDIALEIVNDGATTATIHYIHGPGIDEPLALEKNGQYYFYHQDGLGSVTAITDGRNIVQRYTYDSFGNPRPTTGFQNSYQYTGREWDKETGLYYYRARYYDPIEGRFISKDPISFAGGDQNVYGYVKNKAINFVDPLGLWQTEIAGVEFPLINNFMVPSDEPPSDADTALALLPVGSVGKVVKGGMCAAPEKLGKDIAKRIAKDLGPKYRRIFHDLEKVGERTKEELFEDAKYVYKLAGKLSKIPRWME